MKLMTRILLASITVMTFSIRAHALTPIPPTPDVEVPSIESYKNLAVDPKFYGAIYDGTTPGDDALDAAIVVATIKGQPILISGPLKLTRTHYLNSLNYDMMFIVFGLGHGSKLILSGINNAFAFKLNEDSGGNLVLPWPAHPRLIVTNLDVDGSGSTNASFLWSNEASWQFRNVYFKNIKYGAQCYSYVDQVTFENIHWTSPRAGGALYINQAEGDGLVMNQIFCDSAAAVAVLSNCAGATFTSCNGGSYSFTNCCGINVIGGHFEYDDTADAFYIANSTVNLKNNYLWNNNHTYHPININDDPANPRPSQVSLDGNSIYYWFRSTDYKNADVWISNLLKGGKVTTHASYGGEEALVGQNLAITWYQHGLLVRSGISALDTILATGLAYTQMSSDMEISYDGSWRVLPAGNGNIPLRYFPNPSMTSATIVTDPVGDTGYVHTYYYKCALMNAGFSPTTAASGEISAVRTADGQTVQLVVGCSPGAMLRLYRGTASGTYTSYADIPVTTDTLTLHDKGSTISGFLWSSGSPAVPTANATADGFIDLYGQRNIFGTGPPTNGYWNVGDRVINTSPADGAYSYLGCITAGTPGTWEGFGNIGFSVTQ